LSFGFGCLIVRAPPTQHLGPGLSLVETPLPSIDVADALLDERGMQPHQTTFHSESN
jgi:hypothetical protein